MVMVVMLCDMFGYYIGICLRFNDSSVCNNWLVRLGVG